MPRPELLEDQLDRITHHGSVIDPAAARSARLSVASAAIAGGWEGDVGAVLDMLGLRPGSEVPA